MSRPSRQETMLAIASTIAQRSTCCRRKVGCVLVDSDNRVLSMGHNGVPMKQPHCSEISCPGASLPSGTGLDQCFSVHAEQNALLFCSDVMKIYACYVTASPCITCIKMLLNTQCKIIYFSEEYPHAEAKKMWLLAGRSWVKV